MRLNPAKIISPCIVGALLLAGATIIKAANGIWTADASGNWSDTSKWNGGIVADGSGATADFSTINITADRTVTLDAPHTLTTLKFGDTVPDSNWFLSGANTLTLAGTSPSFNVVNQTATVSSVIAGSAGLTETGAGVLDLNGSAVNTFTGTMAVNAGTLTEDFSNLGTPANLVNSGVSLSLAGGTLNINGAASGATSQTFAGTTFGTGGNVINVVNNGASATLALGGLTYSGTANPVEFITSGGATITTTSQTTGPKNIMWNSYETYGASDWATTTGSSPYTIVGLSSVSSGYVTSMGGTSQGQNLDLQANYTGGSANFGTTTVRFNTPTATSINVHGKWGAINAVLVTPNMGANNCSIGNGQWFATYNTSAATEWIVQNNTSAYFSIGSLVNDESGTKALTYVQSGPGTVVMPGSTTVSGSTGNYGNGFTGQTYLEGGQTVVMVDQDLGAASTGAQVNLNSGTIVGGTIGTVTVNGGTVAGTVSGGATVTLDNNGANKRNIVLGNAGGGLAAVSTSTLTVDGSVQGSGSLVIGIPASSANNNTAGLLPGTGSGTANSAVYAIGTVVLSGGSGNNYSGGTVLDSGTLQFTSGSLGTGGVTFNGGALQWSGNTYDISSRTVAINAGGGTIDVNGNAVTLANAIGNNGNGALTVQSTASGSSLNLQGASTYSGGTTVSNCTLYVNNATGSATGSGNVEVINGATLGGNGSIIGAVEIQSGGILSPGNSGVGTNTVGSLTLDSGSTNVWEFSGTVNDTTVVSSSGGLTINGGTFELYQAGTTTPFTVAGTYNLIQYSGGINGTGISAFSVGNPQTGYTYAFGSSGGYVTLTIGVVSSVNIGTWGVDANGNWSAAGNWTATAGTMPPRNAGDSATFGTGSALRTVTLDADETVGSLSMNNNNSFVIANGGHTLTLDNEGAGVNLNVTGGSANSIQTAVALNDGVTVSVSTNKSVSFAGTIANAGTTPETLAINGPGVIALSGNNTYGPPQGTVGTTLGAVTAQVGNGNAFGTGDVAVSGSSTIQAGAAGLNLANNFLLGSGATATVDNNGNNLALSGNITPATSGDGGITKINHGTLTLSGNNSYTGSTTVNAGILSVSSSDALGGNGLVNLNGGDLFGNGSYTLGNNIGIGPVSGGAGTNALIDVASGQQFNLGGIVASAGNTGTNNLLVNSGTGNNGELILSGANTFGGATVIFSGLLDVQNSAALEDSTVNYNNQGGYLVFDSGITAATLGGLTGGQNLALTNLGSGGVTLTIGNNGSSTTYGGNLTDTGLGGAFTKAGSGTLTLGGTNSFNGSTTVSAGVLQLNNSAVLDCGTADVAAGAELVVNGATLVATNNSYAYINTAVSLLVSSGSATYLGALNQNNSQDANSIIECTGGSLTAGSMGLGRGGSGWFTTQPTAGLTVSGLYVDGGAVDIIGNLDMSSSSQNNSTVNARMNAGSLTVGGQVIIGLNNGSRWSVLDVNGGTLTVTNTNAGISVGGPNIGNAELLIRNGVASVGQIALGYGTVADTTVLNQTGGSLYLGSGGIIQVSPNATASITLGGGLLGATTNWICTNAVQLTGAETVKAADPAGNPWIISLAGAISGTGPLVSSGPGTNILSAVNTYTGSTIVSNGTLSLVSPGSIAATSEIAVGAGATFDVSTLGDYAISSLQTLAGISTNGAGNVAAGGNTLTLQSGATASFQAAGGAAASIGKIVVAGNVALNNNSITVNVSGSTLGAGTYRLLDCSGTLTGIANSTPTITGTGITSGATASIVTVSGPAGHVDLVVAATVPTVPPQITGFGLTNGNVVINATNGLSGGTYYLLTTTNLGLPISQWTCAATNVVTTNGASEAFTFIGTNAASGNLPQQFYILSSTNN